MTKTLSIPSGAFYYTQEPTNPQHGDIWAIEDDAYIKAFVYYDSEWRLVVDVISDKQKGRVYISFVENSEDSEDSEEIDQLDYQYRIGAL